MISVLVFSKDRPLQLHAYLESLLKFSDIDENQITVLYYETAEINYDNTKNVFRRVKWLREKEFNKQLIKYLTGAEKYVLFGCDDVVYRRPFKTVDIERCLENNDKIWGVSLRLGENIKPLPEKIIRRDGYVMWNWSETNATHYNYPWELDGTVYRRDDALKLISKYDEFATNPNNLEGIGYKNVAEDIQRPYMAMEGGENKAIVITVNRVQDTALNDVDGRPWMSPSEMQKTYLGGKRLDIDKIAVKSTNVVHVDSSFVVLTGSKPWDSAKKNALFYLRNFKHNFTYFFTHDIASDQMMRRDEAIRYIHDENKKGRV